MGTPFDDAALMRIQRSSTGLVKREGISTMKYIQVIWILGILAAIGSAQTMGKEQIGRYEFGIYSQYDLRNSSSNAISVHRALHDLYNQKAKPNLGEKWQGMTYNLFSFSSAYLTLLWSHEFGHSLRAKQVGGKFKIHNVALPIPYTTMHLPDSITLVDEALSVTAGFEVNTLNTRSIQREFILRNGGRNEDLAFALVNRLMFPLYTSVIIPINPEERDVWIDTAGDPVHVTLPVFKNYSDNQVFMADSSVNPDLVNYYKQSAIFSILFHLLDPQFYKEFGATFGEPRNDREPTYIIGDYVNGWTYGTLFNVSPLGYELYLNNYIHVDGNAFSFYLKYGRPFKNNGMGLIWNEIVNNNKTSISAVLEAWDQDIFGKGFAGEGTLIYKLSQNMGVIIKAGYKTEGYILGKQVAQGYNWSFGLKI